MLIASPKVLSRTRLPLAPGSRQRFRSYASTPGSASKIVPLWIDGRPESSSSAGTVQTRHAKTLEPASEVVVAGEVETDRAVRSSMKAFGEWRETTGWKRREVLGNVVSLLKERSSLLSEALAADIRMSPTVVGADQQSAINLTDGAAATAISVDGWIPPSIDSTTSLVLREPHGPGLSIPAFNFPLTLALRSIVYPIACGNTVILKSSPLVPQLHQLLGPLFTDAGLPDGVLQILNFSEADVGQRVEQLIAHNDVRMVNFTGSTSLGRHLSQLCGKHLKPSLMELGGKCPAIVLPGADLKLAANNVLFGAFLNSGQICMSTERVIVDRSIAKAFEAALREAAKSIQDKRFDLVRKNAVGELKTLVDDAIQAGAKHILAEPKYDPTSSSPIILSDVPPASRAYLAESFSPLLTIVSADSPDHAVEIANSHPAGLSSAVFTSDLSLALRIAKKLEVGAVHINSMTVHDQHTLPFGGVRDSGWGRFNGRGAIEAFTRTKTVRLGTEGHMLPLDAL